MTFLLSPGAQVVVVIAEPRKFKPGNKAIDHFTRANKKTSATSKERLEKKSPVV